MKVMQANNETFALRDGEKITIVEGQPTSGRHFAVMARSVQMPAGPQQPTRQTDGAPVKQAAIVACQINTNGLWQWMQLSPATKENVGDLLFDSNAETDRWYFATVE